MGREAVTRYELLSVFSSRLSDIGQSVVSLPVQKNGGPANRNQKTDIRKPISEFYSLVRLFPKTGRTHQIRVHLKYIGYPIFSDPIYGGRKTARSDRKVLNRIFLHAEQISFNDPRLGERVTFRSQLPKELLDFLNDLMKINN